MAKAKPDPLGADFWKRLTEDQNYLCAALTDDYKELRRTVDQQNNDAARRITGNVRWEKLYVLNLLDVDSSRRDNVYVRRGKNWSRWWDKFGARITGDQLSAHEVAEIDIDLDISDEELERLAAAKKALKAHRDDP